MTKRFAFTLAEVLIALAIIGVVAAMTIPTFMANTAGAQFRTGLKKGITVLTQAASANYATEGYDFSGTNGAHGATDPAAPVPVDMNASATDCETIGFNTQSDASQATTQDKNPDTPSLFHLFQNNLNMKNSNEVANYAVMPVNVGLNCYSTNGGTVNIPGGGTQTIANVQVDAANTPSAAMQSRASLAAVHGFTASGIQAGGGITGLCDGRALTNNGAGGGINQGYMFMLEDGMVFTYDPAQAYCTEANPCFGYLDVNGPAGPNRVIACSEAAAGTSNNNAWIHTYGRNADAGNLLADCTVESKDITDIYPVLFYGSAVKPASRAAKSVLYSKKTNQQGTGSSSSTSTSTSTSTGS